MRALDRSDETDSRTESSIRVADLEALVCDLLRQNQILREELASLRPRAIAYGLGAPGKFAGHDSAQ
jgi:hypothetical protein